MENSVSLPVRLWPVLIAALAILLLLAEPRPSPAADLLADEVDGLILRRTLTREGHAFYDQFACLMGDTGDLGAFNIVVSERLLPQTGGQIWIEVNGRHVFDALLPRNRDPHPAVERAVEAVETFMLQSYFENGDPGRGLGSVHEFY